MSIKTYERENDLCLLQYDDKFWYIGCLDLPQKDWTIDQYNNWQHKHTVNLIALNDAFVPQTLSHYGLKIAETAGDVCKYWQVHYGKNNDNDKGKDFKVLLQSLLSVKDGDFRKAFYSYFEDFYSVF